MKGRLRSRALLVATPALCALAFAGSSGAGDSTLPPFDEPLLWSQNGTELAYETNAPLGGLGFAIDVRDMRTGATRELVKPFSAGTDPEVLSPDFHWLAYVDQKDRVSVKRPDGSDAHELDPGTAGFDWNPRWSSDSQRLFFDRRDRQNVTLVWVANRDGSGLRQVAPAELGNWSPDGTRLAYVCGVALCVKANGSAPIVRAPSTATSGRWSPDGRWLAFVRDDGSHRSLVIAAADGAVDVRVVGPTAGGDHFAWAGDSTKLAYTAADGVRLVDLASEANRLWLANPYAQSVPLFAPTGDAAVYTWNRWCDGAGLWLAHLSAVPPQGERLTLGCTHRGSARADRIVVHGAAAIVDGLGGNDRIVVDDRALVRGGPGADVISTGYGNDSIDGGPGNDTIHSGIGQDTITPGPGRDWVDAGGSADVVYAADGERDTIHCGTNRDRETNHERDVVFADHVDRISGCETVYFMPEAGEADLAITLWPDGSDGAAEHWTVRCEPLGGTLPRKRRACDSLARLVEFPWRGCPGGETAPTPQTAHIAGTYRHTRIDVHLSRAGACQINRWDALAALLPVAL